MHRVALKRIVNVFRTKTDAKRTLREISILRQCHHPNIVKLKFALLLHEYGIGISSFQRTSTHIGAYGLSKSLLSYPFILGVWRLGSFQSGQ